jgi:FkbM family methyltransferase
MVICFEPGPALFNSLSTAVSNNKLKNFQLYNLGCSNIESVCTWNFDKENPGNAYLTNVHEDEGETKIKVVTIDQIILKEKNVDFIKIDVEGMELNVLIGAKNLIRANLPLILIETNTGNELELNNTSNILNYLSEEGYTFFAVKNKEEELDLKYNGLVEMMPVYFPNVPQNTLAVPIKRVIEFGLE